MTHRQLPHQYRDEHNKQHRASLTPASHNFQPPSSDILFHIDRKGDVQNLRYGSIDKYKVPKYRTFGHGRLVGLDRRYRIISNDATSRQIDNEALDLDGRTRNSSSLVRSHIGEEPVQLLRTSLDARDEFHEQADYVSLGRKRRRLSKESDSLDNASALARPSAKSPTGYEVELASDGEISSEESEIDEAPDERDEFEVFKNHPDNKRFIELRRHTDREPQNVQAWLDFIDHQDRYFMLSSRQNTKSLTASQSRAVTDMKVSLYEKAMAVVKDKQAKDYLVLGLMKEGTKIWDTDKQLKEWRLVLKGTESIKLWYEFLDFQQSNVISFTYEKCLEVFNAIFGITSNLEGQDHDYHCVYLVLRLTTFMRQAGFPERAFAIWQALLEYNLLEPGDQNNSIEALEIFWEGEHPRVGEQGASGWYSTMDREVPSYSDEPFPNFEYKSLFAQWGHNELERSEKDIISARTLDNTLEDDPFRVILFSDVKDYIFRIKSADGGPFLQQAFLKFCGLPPRCQHIEQCRKWWVDPFLCDFAIDMAVGELAGTDALFAASGSPFHIWPQVESRNSTAMNFALQALKLLTESHKEDSRLAEYTIAFGLSRDQAWARRFAKTLLKHQPNSLLLYNAYALVDVHAGRLESADNVWSTALSMAGSLGPAIQHHNIVLWHSWIWHLMEQQQYTRVSNLLTTVLPSQNVDAEVLQLAKLKQGASTAQHLQADAFFRDKISDSVGRAAAITVELTALYALFIYLRHHSSLNKAIEVYEFTLSLVAITRQLQAVERLHQSRARLAHLHANTSTSGYRPMQMVELFEESRRAFPDNMIFFKLNERYLQRAGVVDRLRRTNSEMDKSTTGVMSLLDPILREISRPSYSGTTYHSVRRAFANATASGSPTRNCPSLWLVWIRWELLMVVDRPGSSSRTAVDVYLSALRLCPWSKELYLESFIRDSLRKALGEGELERIYRSISERGLRLRHDISDMLEDKSRE